MIQGTAVPPVPTLDSVQVATGEQLYAVYCAECHEIALDGEPNWRVRGEGGSYPAPLHDSSGHTWHHPYDLLIEIIAKGGDPVLGSSLPGFEDELSLEDMHAILAFLKSYWG